MEQSKLFFAKEYALEHREELLKEFPIQKDEFSDYDWLIERHFQDDKYLQEALESDDVLETIRHNLRSKQATNEAMKDKAYREFARTLMLKEEYFKNKVEELRREA